MKPSFAGDIWWSITSGNKVSALDVWWCICILLRAERAKLWKRPVDGFLQWLWTPIQRSWERRQKPLFFLACCHSHTFSQAVPHNKFRNQRGKTLKPWRDWKDLQHMTRYESAIIVIVNTHTHTRTGRNRMQCCFPKFHTFAAIPIQETTWCITLAKPHIYKQVYSI